MHQTQTQTGNVLILSLAILAALSALGISSMRGALVAEKLARSTQDSALVADSITNAVDYGMKIMATKLRTGLSEFSPMELMKDENKGFYDTRIFGVGASHIFDSAQNATAGSFPDLTRWSDSDADANYRLLPAEYVPPIPPDLSAYRRAEVPRPKIKIELYSLDKHPDLSDYFGITGYPISTVNDTRVSSHDSPIRREFRSYDINPGARFDRNLDPLRHCVMQNIYRFRVHVYATDADGKNAALHTHTSIAVQIRTLDSEEARLQFILSEGKDIYGSPDCRSHNRNFYYNPINSTLGPKRTGNFYYIYI